MYGSAIFEEEQLNRQLKKMTICTEHNRNFFIFKTEDLFLNFGIKLYIFLNFTTSSNLKIKFPLSKYYNYSSKIYKFC